MLRLALAGTPLQVFGIGDQIRDYVFVEDVARAFVAAAEHIDSTLGKHFLVGSGEGHTIWEAANAVAEKVKERTGAAVEVMRREAPVAPGPIESRNFIADVRRLRAAAGWQPRIGLREGLSRTIDSMLAEPAA